MVNGLGYPNNFGNWPVTRQAPDRLQPFESGLILREAPKANRSEKSFGPRRFGQIVEEAQIVSGRGESQKNKQNNSNQQGSNNGDDTNASKHLDHMNAYANSVRERIKQDTVARATMTDLNQPITQKQLLALNTKLNTIDDKLNQLLGSKAANTEQWGLRKALLVDNPHGNSEIDVA